MKQFAPAAQRNVEPIMEVLARHLPQEGDVLEIASGTGLHVAHFAQRFSSLVFQPTDPDPEARASIQAWVSDVSNPNLKPPLALDVTQAPWPVQDAKVVININMIHISPWSATQALMKGAAQVLGEGGLLFLYGPFIVDGRATASSNEAFDASLRVRDARWGIRRLTEVEALAGAEGFERIDRVDMPANNLSIVFRRLASSGASV